MTRSRRAAGPGRLWERSDAAELAAEPRSDFRLYGRIVREARSYWSHIGGLFLLSLLATPLALLAPLPVKIAVDSVVGGHDVPGFIDAVLPAGATASDSSVLAVAAGLLLFVALLTQVQNLGTELLGTYAGEKLVLDFRSRLFRHGQRLSLAYHDSRGTSDSIYRIWYDAPAIQWVAVHGLTPFVTAGLTLCAMIAVTAAIDWELAVVALTVAPLLYALTLLYKRRLRRGWTQVKELETDALSVVQEVVGSLRVVKAFGQEDREQERFQRRSNETVRARVRVTFIGEGLRLLLGVATALGTAAVLYIGIRHVQSGILTLGELLLVMGYLAQIYAPLQQISQSIAALQGSLASAERAFSLLDEAPDVPEKPHALELDRARGEAEFRGVSFAYGDGELVLRDVTFSVEEGMRVGIVGSTGAGKTTLISLLSRFYDPSDGAILLDGVDIREHRIADLRRQFAIVLQDPVLFSTTIGENIAYARPDASEDEIVAAARAANAHDFIAALAEGYDTPVGERGMRLSGGERQRISLARAFLKDAPILLLDEPTSSVDNRTEAAIMDAMERLMHGRTTFMIAHRLTTLRTCDLLIEVEHGRVVSVTRDVRGAIDRALQTDVAAPAAAAGSASHA